MESWESDVGELKKMELEKMDEVWGIVEKKWECRLPLSNMKELSRNFKEEETNLKRYLQTFW